MGFFSKTLDKLKGALKRTAEVLNTDVRTLFIPGRKTEESEGVAQIDERIWWIVAQSIPPRYGFRHYEDLWAAAVKKSKLRPASPRDTTSHSTETSGMSARTSPSPHRPVMIQFTARRLARDFTWRPGPGRGWRCGPGCAPRC